MDSDKIDSNTLSSNNPRFNLKHFPQSSLLTNTLNEMFPEQAHEDKTVQKAREILGEKYTTDDVKSQIASFEYLINIWMEEYEKKVFNNKTLKELIQDL